MGPVFLFHMRIVIFFVGAGAGELDCLVFGSALTEVKQLVIDELTVDYTRRNTPPRHIAENDVACSGNASIGEVSRPNNK
jgi:hypothetical protein